MITTSITTANEAQTERLLTAMSKNSDALFGYMHETFVTKTEFHEAFDSLKHNMMSLNEVFLKMYKKTEEDYVVLDHQVSSNTDRLYSLEDNAAGATR